MTINNIQQKGTIRGYVRSISDARELSRSNGHFKTGYYFLKIDIYRINEEKIDRKKPLFAKLYISDSALGQRDIKKSVIYYATNDLSKPNLEFQTGLIDLRKLIDQYVGVKGMISTTDEFEYSYFIRNVEKLKIFPKDKNYFKKI